MLRRRWIAVISLPACCAACGGGGQSLGKDGGTDSTTGPMTDAGSDATGPTDAPKAADAETPSEASPGSDSSTDAKPGADGSAPATVSVLTNRYDNSRSGANTNETLLTTSNVNTTTFGFKFSANVTGRVYGQPLYVPGLTIGSATHNVVYVATEHNMVYAFDADNGTTLWARTLPESPAILGQGQPFDPGCADMGSGAATYEVGITSTPVIDPTSQLIYVVAKTEGKQMIHALSLTTGDDGPTAQQVGPSGFSSDDVPLNRPGLLLLDGTVYVAFGSHCDAGDYHGWIFGQDATTLALTSTYETTPTGSEGAIWQGGVGLSSDGTGIWFAVGNGTTGGGNMGMSVVRVTPSGSTMTVGQNKAYPADGDNDLSGGAVLVSQGGNDYVLAGGKSGYVILLNAADASQADLVGVPGEVHNVATWNGGSAGQFVYTWGTGTPLYSWVLTGGSLTAQQTNNVLSPGHPGGMVTVSSNGTTPDTGVVWALVPTGGDAWHSTAPAALYAFDAANITTMLWNSNQDQTPTAILGACMTGSSEPWCYAKWSPPTVANGKVYAAVFPESTAAGQTGQLMVYGLK